MHLPPERALRRPAAPAGAARDVRPTRPSTRGRPRPSVAASRRPPGARPAGPARRPALRPSTRCSSRCCAPSGPTHPEGRRRGRSSGPTRSPSAAHRGPEAQERRPVHHPPARGRHDPRRARHDPADAGRRAAARHGRGHRRTRSTTLRERLRRRGRRCWSTASPSSTRSSTARPRRPRPSARWSSRWPGHPGAGHQARRPAAQHAHLRYVSAGEAGAQGPRDAGDLRAAGPPARHEHDQVGARGPRRSRPSTPRCYDEIVRLVAERAPERDEYLAQRHRRRSPADLRGRQDQGHGHRPAEALLLDLPEDDRARPRLRRHLRPGRHPGPGRHRPRLLRGARRHPRALEPGARPVQGLHRDAQVQHVPVAAHDGDRARAASRSSCRSAPSTCTAAPSTASPRTGSTRRTATPACPRRRAKADGDDAVNDMAWLRQLLDWQRETEDPGEFLESLRFDLNAARGLRLHAQGRRHRAAGRRRPRSTSPTPCTPRSATAASAPGSTAGWCRWRATLDNGDVVEVFTSKADGAGPSPRLAELRQEPRGRATRSGSGSPRSAARRRSSRARTPSPRRCASRTCRSSGC